MSGTDSDLENVCKCLDELTEQKRQATKLLEKWRENDLNFVHPSHPSWDQFRQDTSDIQQTDHMPDALDDD